MPVIVNGKAILPAPVASFSKNTIIADDGTNLGAGYTLSLQGKILQNKGNPISATGASFVSSMSVDSWTTTQSPDDDPLHNVGDSDLLISTITKMEQLRDLVSPATGIKVEVVGFAHDQGLKFYGDLKSFTVDSEGNWAKPASYTMEFDFANFISSASSGIFSNGSSEDSFPYYISSVNENWSIQEGENVVVNTGNWGEVKKVYSISHSVEAQGKRVYDSSGNIPLKAWQQASGYINSVVGLGPANIPQGLLYVASGYYITNRTMNETINRSAGSYQVEETFAYVPSGLFPSGILAFETCSISVDKSESSLTSVSIDGSIKGIETNLPTGVSGTSVSKYTNALSYYGAVESSLYNRVKQNIGSMAWLHPRPISSSVGRFPNAGEITYKFSYDNRPPNIVANSISEEISIDDTYPGQLYSATPVIGRSQPVLQYLGSRSEYKRTLNINVQMGDLSRNWGYSDDPDYASRTDESGRFLPPTGVETRSDKIKNWLFTQKPSIASSGDFQAIYDAANPANESGVIPTKVFYDAPQESWNPKSGSYTYSVGWTYEKEQG